MRGSRTRRTITRGICCCVLLALLAACSEPTPPVAELRGQTMGTSYSIKLSPPPDPGDRAELQRLVDARLDEINRQMSTYLPDSDLTRFNLADSTDWQPVPRAIIELVERAARISALSDGMYDVTVGPLVNLWGFGNAGERRSPPGKPEIAQLLGQVGYRHLETRDTPPAMRKAVAALQVDLSSIAKGWAVDQIGALLASQGYSDYLVEIGGEVLARGAKQAGRPWRVAVEQPLAGDRAVQRVIALRDMAMATSGDYRNFFTDRGQQYSHTIDPKTGQAVQHRLASVTVLDPECAQADAWATALMALGDRHAPAVAAEQGLMALFILRTAEGFHEQASPALASSALWQPQP